MLNKHHFLLKISKKYSFSFFIFLINIFIFIYFAQECLRRNIEYFIMSPFSIADYTELHCIEQNSTK